MKTTPDHNLPEGFRKVIEKEIDYEYQLPVELGIPEKFKVCYELMDEIVSNILDVHMIEPIIYFRNIPKAKPKLTPSVTSKLYSEIKLGINN